MSHITQPVTQPANGSARASDCPAWVEDGVECVLAISGAVATAAFFLAIFALACSGGALGASPEKCYTFAKWGGIVFAGAGGLALIAGIAGNLATTGRLGG